MFKNFFSCEQQHKILKSDCCFFLVEKDEIYRVRQKHQPYPEANSSSLNREISNSETLTVRVLSKKKKNVELTLTLIQLSVLFFSVLLEWTLNISCSS